MTLVLSEHPGGVVTPSGDHVVYDLDRNEASFGASRVEGAAIVWELTHDLGAGEWILRCDRVDFPPGGIAYRHVHPGGGVRRILHGALTIDRGDGDPVTYSAGESWFEGADDAVLATASATVGIVPTGTHHRTMNASVGTSNHWRRVRITSTWPLR